MSESSSDSSLKAKATGGKDSTPLLNGRNLVAFPNLSLSSTSSSVDLELDELGKMIKPTDLRVEAPPGGRDRTFEDVRPDLNLNDIASDDSDKIV
jgi:hypothetical protein